MRTLTLAEAKLLLREPLALFWGLAMPMVLLSVMGWSTSSIDGVPLVAVYEPIVIAFIGVVFGVQGIPVQVAAYRERRILRRLATTPAGPVRVVGAQLIVSLIVVLAATAGAPIAATRPASRMATRSQSRSASSMKCVTSMMVTPWFLMSLMSDHVSRRATGSSPVVSSSRIATRGRPMSARAIDSRCFWPPDSRRYLVFRFSVRSSMASRPSVSAGCR